MAPRAEPPRYSMLALRLATLVALAVSAALLVDYLRPTPAFCDLGSGCDQVRLSGFGHIGGAVPLPAIGLAYFASLLGLSVAGANAPRPRGIVRALAPLAMLGGITGAGLLLVQALVVHAFCKLCVIVDLAAIVTGIAGFFLWRAQARPASERAPEAHGAAEPDGHAVRSSRSPGWLWPAAGVLSVALPLGWGFFQPGPPVPPQIAALWVPGKINVVEFADFQCPFCRKLHPAMTEVLHDYADRVHFVRLNMPLASHAQSRDAARAYCCADEQGRGTQMADALFGSPGLSPQDCERLASELGLSVADFRKCVANPATEKRIDEQVARVHEAGLRGLPTVWVGDQVLVGLQPIDALRDAFATAATNGAHFEAHSPAWLWGGLALALGSMGAVAFWRANRRGGVASRPMLD